MQFVQPLFPNVLIHGMAMREAGQMVHANLMVHASLLHLLSALSGVKTGTLCNACIYTYGNVVVHVLTITILGTH